MARISLPDNKFFDEGATGFIEATLREYEAGPVIPGSALTSLTLTLFEEVSRDIINGRNAQNVLQLNGVTVDENGLLRWKVTAADNVILFPNRKNEKENHIALFTFGWNDGAGGGVGKYEIVIPVRDLRRNA